MIKKFFFAVAIAWLLVNLAGLGIAARDGEPGHAGVHLLIAAALGVVAWYLRPRRRKATPEIQPAPPLATLTDEIDRLQRELDEAQRGRDFAEDLLHRRNPPDAR